MSDDLIVLREGINFILIMTHLGSSHSSLKTPIPVKSLSQFQECWAARNSIFPTWAKYFFFSVAATQSFGPTRPHTQWVLGADSPEVKWQELEAVHSLPSGGAKFKNVWSFISIPHMSSWSSASFIRYRANFTLTCLVIYVQVCIS
jgi:hypothetical protein